MSNPNVEFLIIPGSFATPPPYDLLVSLLAKAGYRSSISPLLSSNDGTRLPPATMAEDAASIRSAILAILDDPTNPRNVVLAPHSYAGFPASEAAAGLSPSARKASGKETAIIGIVYMASFLPFENQSLRDVMSAAGSLTEEMRVGVPGGYLPAIPVEFAGQIFNDVEDPGEVARLHATMGLHSSDSYSGKVSYAAWRDIQSVQVIPGKDVIVPVDVQEGMYKQASEAAPGMVSRWFVEGAGHCPMWTSSKVQDVVDALVSVLGEN